MPQLLKKGLRTQLARWPHRMRTAWASNPTAMIVSLIPPCSNRLRRLPRIVSPPRSESTLLRFSPRSCRRELRPAAAMNPFIDFLFSQGLPWPLSMFPCIDGRILHQPVEQKKEQSPPSFHAANCYGPLRAARSTIDRGLIDDQASVEA